MYAGPCHLVQYNNCLLQMQQSLHLPIVVGAWWTLYCARRTMRNMKIQLEHTYVIFLNHKCVTGSPVHERQIRLNPNMGATHAEKHLFLHDNWPITVVIKFQHWRYVKMSISSLVRALLAGGGGMFKLLRRAAGIVAQVGWRMWVN